MKDEEVIDRLRITRELSEKEYKKLQRHEEKHGQMAVKEIAEMFGFEK